MKREYRKPTIEIVDIETTEACLQAVSWRVKDENYENYDPSTDHGNIIEDKGDGKNGPDDPWDSTDW